MYCVYAPPCIQCPWRPEEDTRCPGPGVVSICVWVDAHQNPNSGPLQGHSTLRGDSLSSPVLCQSHKREQSSSGTQFFVYTFGKALKAIF